MDEGDEREMKTSGRSDEGRVGTEQVGEEEGRDETEHLGERERRGG